MKENVIEKIVEVCTGLYHTQICPCCYKRFFDITMWAGVPFIISVKCLFCRRVVRFKLIDTDNAKNGYEFSQEKTVIKLECPECHKRILDVSRSPSADAEIILKCPHCQQMVTLPVNQVSRTGRRLLVAEKFTY